MSRVSSYYHPLLALQTGHRNALDELLLQQEIQHHYRYNGHCGCRNLKMHQIAVTLGKILHSELDRPVLVIVNNQKRPQESVPGPHEGKDRKSRERRPYVWNHNDSEDLEFGTPVYPGSIYQVVGDSDNELPHQKDPEYAYRTRDDQSQVGVYKAQIVDHYIQRDYGDGKRNHHRAEQSLENDISSSEFVFCKGETGKTGCEQCESDSHGSYEYTVQIIPQEGN